MSRRSQRAQMTSTTEDDISEFEDMIAGLRVLLSVLPIFFPYASDRRDFLPLSR